MHSSFTEFLVFTLFEFYFIVVSKTTINLKPVCAHRFVIFCETP